MRIPFRIDRTRPRALVRQMTDGLRDAIVTGYYKSGDILGSAMEKHAALLVAAAGGVTRTPLGPEGKVRVEIGKSGAAFPGVVSIALLRKGGALKHEWKRKTGCFRSTR